MLNKFQNLLSRYIIRSMVLFILMMTTCSCMALFQLPVMILQLPIQLVTLVFRSAISLLPYLIKYAPLALLFVEKEELDLNEYGIQNYTELKRWDVAPGVECVLLPYTSERQLSAAVETAKRLNDKIIFVAQEKEGMLQEESPTMYSFLSKYRIQFACDTELYQEIKQVYTDAIGVC